MRFSGLRYFGRSQVPQNFRHKPALHSCILTNRSMSTIKPPVLRRAKEDGSEVEILEEELYQYTRYRWLHDEPEKVAIRFRRFNLDALLDVSVRAAGSGARSCVKVVKCLEGQYNKAFLMTMDNGAEVLAKLPNPNAGPAFFTTASEIATRGFLREVLNLPIPRIHTYSLDSSSPVGAEYIIEEKATGKPLGSLWHQWSREAQLDVVTQLVDLEVKLASVWFQKDGCVYYKDDLKSKGHSTQSLEANVYFSEAPPQRLDLLLTDKYSIGAISQAGLWEDGRATMDMDRGPWNNAVDYMMAMGLNEIKWTKACAKPQMNYCRSMDNTESPDEYISLLERYLLLVPHLPPTVPDGLTLKTLSHPDLHLDNVFVDPETKKISAIIDWQSASVSEIGFQHKLPLMLPTVKSSGSDGALKAASQNSDSAGTPDGRAIIMDHYKSLTQAKNPLRWAAINSLQSSLATELVSLIPGAWTRNDIFSFRHALISVAAHWNEFATDSKCPISFTDRELELHGNEMELLEGLGALLHQLQDDNLIPLGGRVRSEDYEKAQSVNMAVKDMFIEMGGDDQQKALHAKLWPY